MAGKPKIPLRPFEAGERVNNPDGSYSTERTRTVQLPGGEWINVPSLWMGPQGPADLGPMSDDFLGKFASEWEAQAGKKWLRFKSLRDAETAAKARSEAGGAGSGLSRYQP